MGSAEDGGDDGVEGHEISAHGHHGDDNGEIESAVQPHHQHTNDSAPDPVQYQKEVLKKN